MQYKKEVYKLAKFCGFKIESVNYTSEITRRRCLCVYIEQEECDANGRKLFHHFESWKEAFIYFIGFLEGYPANATTAELES